ncbi:MAG: sugar phosphate isomerase/epimerase family protein [Armatimonadota bacterium]|nr:sugar phosphate isomerase/epimerase family protein [Armatimonadota bacterium]
MQYGIRENLMGADISLEEKFRRAAELGFDGIEMIPREREGIHGMMAFEKEGREELLRLGEKHALAISSLSLATWREFNCLTTDDPQWQLGVEHLLEAIGAATDLGCTGILLPHFGHMEPSLDDPRLEPDLRGIREAVEKAGNSEILICLECTVDLETMQGIVETASHPQVGIYFDVGNLRNTGHDPAAMIRALGDGVKMIHIKEAGAELVGEGDVDWHDVAAAVGEIGYDEWLVFETAPTDDPMAAMRHNLPETRRHF